MHRPLRAQSLLALAALASALRAQGIPVGFEETFALAPDRAKAVALLVPGTDEHFYYHCRERLAARDFTTVRALLPAWEQRHGRNARVVEIEAREALLSFDRDPERSFRFVTERLGLQWSHQPKIPGAQSPLPTRLDPAKVDAVALRTHALRTHENSLDLFTDAALPGLAAVALTDGQLVALLTRLRRPDLDGLSALVVRELGRPDSGGFGAFEVHRQLRLEQLEECARLRPALLQQPTFVEAWLTRACGDAADGDWRSNPAARAAQLQRLYEFARRLPPSFHSLQAHVLFHWLQHDLAQGALDRNRLLAYLQLPRVTNLTPAGWLDRFPRPDEHVDLQRAFPTALPVIGDDEPLLRACFEQVFTTEDDIAPYAQFLAADWLRIALAETRLLRGDPAAERWHALLADPARSEELRQRLELTFPATRREQYAADEPVTVDLDVKNVHTLLVNVFAIDAHRFHQERQQLVTDAIELDGVVPTHQQTFTYDEPPLHRVRRSFPLPMLASAGTWVVEFVGVGAGNRGTSSRALIQKGTLRAAERLVAAGHEFTVFDEVGRLVPDASLWFGGRDYAANKNGAILLPFSTEPGRKVVALQAGPRAALVRFHHQQESHTLACGVFVAREALVAGQTARLLLSPSLRIAGHAVSLQLLREPVLTLTLTDVDGTQAQREVRSLELVDGREFVHELQVPERLRLLQATLRGTVRDLAGNDVVLTAATVQFPVNGIEDTTATSSPLLMRNAAGFALELRGKNGEPRPGRSLQLVLQHQQMRDPVTLMLQTDAAGRIELGPLADVVSLRVAGNGWDGTFHLLQRECSLPEALHGRVGETLRLADPQPAAPMSRTQWSLLGHAHDEMGRLHKVDGMLELRDLPAGDYVLTHHASGQSVPVRITAGGRHTHWLVGARRALQAYATAPLQLRSLAIEGQHLVVRLANPTQDTRVHVVASQHGDAFDAFDLLQPAAEAPRLQLLRRVANAYQSGRQLGDELRYVRERRQATKFAGNMLTRPSLLLHPWQIDESTNAPVGEASPGSKESAFDSNQWNSAVGLGGGGAGTRGRSAGSRRGRGDNLPDLEAFANLDWLASGARVLANLKPDADGVLRVPLADLGEGAQLQVLALDGEQAVRDLLVRDTAPAQPRPRQLLKSLDATQHFVEQKRIEFVATGGTATIDDPRQAHVDVHDSIASVFGLLASVSRDADLPRFAFLLKWPTLKDAEKQKHFDEHACHELRFFLFHKDRAFFDAVIKPLLANKLEKTFLDHWLLGFDLRGYLEPWAFAHLNLIERILLQKRLGGDEAAAIARSVREANELRPTSPEQLGRLLDQVIYAGIGGAKPGAAVIDLMGFGQGTGDVRQEVFPTEEARKLREQAQARVEQGQAPGLLLELGENAKPESRDELGAEAKEKAPQADADKKRQRAAVDDLVATESLAKELHDRESAPQLYRTVQKTKLLVEHDWWHRRREQATADIVAPNRFWLDYATAPAGQPFASAALVEASTSTLEMLMALAVLDLPFTPGKHEVTANGNQRTLRAASPLLLVRKEVAKAEPAAADQAPLLLGQNCFRLDDRYRFVDGERRDAFVSDEFLVDVAYGCQVVVTNPTSQKRTAEVLLQIPAGALPVQKGFWTKGVPVTLEPYATATVEYAFYFPAAGDFAHYPAHAAERGKLAANAQPRTLHVVPVPTKVDTTSWEHISQQGTTAEVLAFLDGQNIQRLDITKLAWRMRDREVFTTVLAKLRSRHVYDSTLWSYSLLHRDVPAAREYLQHADGLVSQCGMALQSPLLTIDPRTRGMFQQLELDPLVHPRAHQLGGQRVLGNADLARQYASLMTLLGYHDQLDSEDWLVATYYLLLQDRIEEGIAAFGKVDVAKVASKLQYDYLAAYLCFFTGDLQKARQLAERHQSHPVPHWQQRFKQVLSQLDEAAGVAPPVGTGPADLAATAPALDLALVGRTVTITAQNLPECEVRYYELDVEFAFSAQPFAAADGTGAAFVRPNLVELKQLQKGAPLAFELPAQFAQKNVLVEVRAGGLVRSKQSVPSALDVKLLESAGQLAVTAQGSTTPLSKVYVKVFAKLPDGTVRFHKDGYTDLRGRFDYASLSDDPNLTATRYAVLVLDEQRGAVIRETAPPAR